VSHASDEREAELLRSNRELERFAHTAAHDLQEPLRMVARYAELLAQNYQGRLDATADRYLHFLVDGAERMQRLVRDLLQYARLDTRAPALQPVRTAQLVAAVTHELTIAMDEAGATISIAPLPDVLADEGQLHQLFQNLIMNALKFRSSRPLRIDIGADAAGDRVRLFVQDNGVGLDMQHAARIFDPLTRLHPIGAQAGSGLGLAIAKRIVDRHGGRIWFDSQPGEGATVHFTLQPAVAAT
jgi:light-regulated signal transduction histidine kinase (bacteriophytochrome)